MVVQKIEEKSSLDNVASKYSNLRVLPQTNQLIYMLSIVRDRTTNRNDFISNSDRIIRLTIEHALNDLPYEPKTVTTPVGSIYQGLGCSTKICCVSIMRGGEAMETASRDVCNACRIGKILLQRDEVTAQPCFLYENLPSDIKQRYVMLLDPMLATGGSICKAIEILLKHGAQEEKLIVVNIVVTPEGLEKIFTNYPRVKIVCAVIDDGLNEKKFIVPGLGDFGDRYFGTDD